MGLSENLTSLTDRSVAAGERVVADGKYFGLAGQRFYVKGFSYGPFVPNSEGVQFPERQAMQQDFAHMKALGANTLRIYTTPSAEMLDLALASELRLILDVPWDKHRCFFEDWEAREDARRSVDKAAELAAKHLGVLAVSVVNEVPNDVVRFYGHERIEEFIDELADRVKQLAPDCLTTFANYPTTEFLQPSGLDFFSFNVYLHELRTLGLYCDRLQHIAGDRPLLLSEFGIDSHREGTESQAATLAGHVRTIMDHGLAGSVVFSYTDDWHTGGAQVDAWAFGVANADRSEKPAAGRLKKAWLNVPFGESTDLPKVSVVICAYNAASTLRECLESLRDLDYPDYEVIVVDDGSQDETPQIAAQFPEYATIRQENRGLSEARNVGLEQACGEVVAYTDADCVVDRLWLRYLVQAMEDQGVDAIGGPNITPRTDGWVAQCVAQCPGNPSHVMLDDQHAEHIPGCNMAFRRDQLLAIGGFDPQFHVAGDDVDVCWRLLDEGARIGYAAGAFVWHHRRETVQAYLKQQIGYGRAEALLHFVHPHRFSVLGRSIWHGRIYGAGAAGLPLLPERIYYGPFGYAPFQMIYRHNEYGTWACVTWLEWHLVALFLSAVGIVMFWPLLTVSTGMWIATAAVAVKSARQASLPATGPVQRRPLIALLYVLQPIVRSLRRVTYDLRIWRPRLELDPHEVKAATKRVSARIDDVYWQSDDGTGREALLEQAAAEARRLGWLGVFRNAWAAWDIKLAGDLWHMLFISTASENLADRKRFTRARVVAKPTLLNRVFSVGALLWSGVALAALNYAALAIALCVAAFALFQNIQSRQHCLRAAGHLMQLAGERAGLHAVSNEEHQAMPEPGQVKSTPARTDGVPAELTVAS